MKHLLLEKQLSFYKEYGYIEFDNFLTEEEISLLSSEVPGCLTNKVGSLQNASESTLFLEGKDLYFKNPKLFSFCKKKKISTLIKAFSHENLLRLAFDQAFFFKQAFTPSFPSEETLENSYSYQGLVCALIIQLNHMEKESPSLLVPEKKGNLIVVNAKRQLDFSSLFQESTKLYMIGFAKQKAQYVYNPKDPHTHDLKKEGLSFGDFLIEKLHPTL